MVGRRGSYALTTNHRFTVGQEVVFTPGAGGVGVNRLPTMAVVTRRLPMDGVEYQYHVQVEADGLERRVWESQLRPNTRRPEVVDGDAAVAGGAQSSGGPANRIGAHADDADPS
jgi:hypothetical protein